MILTFMQNKQNQLHISHMNNKEFIAALSQKESLLQRDTQKLVNLLVAEITSQFENGSTLTVQNFGQFEVKKKLERVVVNPSSGQRMLVPPKLVLNFKSYPALKERTQKGGES